MTEMASKPDVTATKADPPAMSVDLMAAIDDLEAAIEAQTWRLTVGMIAMGFVRFGSVPFLTP